MRPSPSSVDPGRSRIDALLEEQRAWTAVETFSRLHAAAPPEARSYRALLPATPPGPGQQYAFEVALDQCSGCKACVTACHAMNGLAEEEAWRDVGQLISDVPGRPFQQTVTTACHHCVDPGCLNGCPVLAYDKDPATGIVRHLDDQCIGCQYCVMKCPYEVPKYSEALGIVRKCDLCSQRLAVGEAPACVQACPNEAIRITVIAQEPLRSAHRGETVGDTPWLPAAPDPGITLPTTRFVSRAPLSPELVPGDVEAVRLQPAHWPLVWMLTLTQMSVGTFGVALVVPGASRAALLVAALAAGLLGLGASVLHLGRPAKAWRSFLGWRRSWLSREILVFGLFAGLAVLTAAMALVTAGQEWRKPVLAATCLAGVAGVVCSVMVYHDTRRAFWNVVRTLPKFLLSAALLGLALAWAVTAGQGGVGGDGMAIALCTVTTLKLAAELRFLRRADSPLADVAWPKRGGFDEWSMAQTARWLRGELGRVTRARLGAGLTGGVLLPLILLLVNAGAEWVPWLALGLCLAGELAERFTFFRAVVPPRMPGVP